MPPSSAEESASPRLIAPNRSRWRQAAYVHAGKCMQQLIVADGKQQPRDEEAYRGVCETEAESANRCGSEVEYQVAVGAGAADERLVASGHFQGVGGVGDVPGQDWRDAGVADAGSAGPSGGDVAGV